MATIDILLPVRNGVAFLAESLDSVQAQTFKDWRLLVLDHGSVDGTVELAARYCALDPRIELHSFPQADGLSGLLNKGLEISDCQYVMRHDADDICDPHRMEISLAAFRDNPGCVAIGGQAEVIDAKGAHIGDMKMPVGRARVTAASFFRNPIAHPTAMLDFAEMQKLGVRYGNDFLGLMPQEQSLSVLNLAEDYFLFGQLAIQGKCTNVPQQLIRYRWHGNNVSAKRFDEQMVMSVRVARYLARNFCAMFDVPFFDPAPFCSMGGLLFDMGSQKDFEQEFAVMARSLRQVLGSSAEVERELQYRHVAATRNVYLLAWRYLNFALRHEAEAGEWNAVRSWMLRHIRKKAHVSVEAEMAA